MKQPSGLFDIFLFVIMESDLINGRYNQFEPAQFFWYIPPFLSFPCLYPKSLIRLRNKTNKKLLAPLFLKLLGLLTTL